MTARPFALAVLAALLCATSHGPAAAQDWDGTDADLTRIRKAIAGRLNDPSSAAFGDVTVRTGFNGRPVVCGLVADRDPFGGPAQPRGFFHTDQATVLPSPSDNALLANMGGQLFESVCGPARPVIRTVDWSAR